MKKLLLLVVFCCLVAVLGATAGVVSLPTSPQPASKVAALAVPDLLASGKQALYAHNIIAARDNFKAAVTQEPANQEANFLYAVTRIFAVFEQNYGATTGLDSVKEIFERTGFTFSTFGLYSIDGNDPVDGPLSTMPRTGEVISFIDSKLLPELNGAVSNLEKVTSTSFSSTIAPSALNTYGDSLQADYADVLAVKALVHLLRCNLNLLVVYGPDVHIPDIAAAPDQLMTYKQLLANDSKLLTPNAPARLTTAKEALISFIDTYDLAAIRLQMRPGATHHLFVADVPWDGVTNEPIDTSSDSLTEVSQMLATVKASLYGAQTFPGDSPVQDRRIDLSKFFNAAAPISIRANLSDCAGSRAFPDATLGGLFPLGLSAHPQAVADIGPHVLGLTCAGKGAPLIDVEDGDLWFNNETPGPKPLSINNRGTGPLTISAIGFIEDGAEYFTVDKGTCTSLTPTLAAGASCQLALSMKRDNPSPNGYAWSELAILSNDLNEPVIYSYLSGSVQTGGGIGGTISGTLKDAVTGAPVQGYVNLFRDGSDYSVSAWATNGEFTINNLPMGTYRIKNVPNGEYPQQWYNNKASRETADPVVLGASPVTVPFLLSKGGTVTGFFKDAATGAAVTDGYVQLVPVGSDTVANYNQYLPGGFFSIIVAPGSYRVRITGSSDYPTQWYNNGAAVNVTASGVTSLGDIIITKGATISGQVTAEAGGSALANVQVYLHSAQSGEYVASASTDSTGAYSIRKIPSGSYKVRFDYRSSQYYPLWYGNVTRMDTATVVTVSAPNSVTGINAALKVGGSISGVVSSPDDPHDVYGIRVTAENEHNWDVSAETDYAGRYTISGLAPGTYRIRFDGADRGYARQYYSLGQLLDEFQPVQVTASVTTNGIDAVLSRGGAISGLVRDSAGAPIPGVEVVVFDANGNELDNTETESDGRYGIWGLSSGEYKVGFRGFEKGYVGAFYGGVSLNQAARIKVNAPITTTGINASLVKGGSISGTVTDSAGMPLVHAEVHLFDASGQWMSDAETDAQGRYKAGGLPAGSYKLFADTEGNDLAGRWYNGTGNFAAATAIDVGVGSLADVAGVNVKLGSGDILVSPNMGLDFGNVVTSSTGAFRIVEIYNAGTTDLVPGTVKVTGANAADFSLSHDSCSGKSVPAGGNCSVRVYFSPAAQAARSAVLSVPYNAAATTSLNIALKGTGTASTGSTSTTVVSSLNPATQGQSVTFTATVTPALSGAAAPTGSVTFKDGATVLGTIALSGGKATFSTSALAAGNHSITASYPGSGSYSGSTSAPLVQEVRAAQATLTVVTGGTGRGSVNSTPSGIACASGSAADCSVPFNRGVTVALMATPSANSFFSGWSGGVCSGTAGCQVTMDAAKSVTATFTANPATVLIENVPTYFYTLGGALDAITSAKTVRAKAQLFTENVIMTTGHPVVLKGGFAAEWQEPRPVSSFTVLDGYLKVRQGKLTVERLKIR